MSKDEQTIFTAEKNSRPQVKLTAVQKDSDMLNAKIPERYQ